MSETPQMREIQELEKEQKTIYSAGIYLRLSREDGDKTESDSISNQRELLIDFLNRNPELLLHEIWIDDGYSGVDFQRPGFEKMMEAVKAGEINCIIVKDFSRLGRNFIETGKYIERIFPFMGVRFIAVNDNYDSAKLRTLSDNLLVPVKNLINDAYCRDISIKIRSQLAVKRKMGQCIAPFAVYGYQKSLDNRHKLVVDQLAAGVVQDIFQWKLEGYSAGTIAKRLNDLGVLSPMEYKEFLGSKFFSPFKQNSKAGWTSGTILRILKDPVYMGTLAQGRRSRPNYKIKKPIEIPKDKWIVAEHCHEPIVSKEIFENVARLLEADTRTSPGNEVVFMLAGLLYCGDCKRSMSRKNNSRKEKPYYYYICSGYKQRTGCKSHSIRSLYVEEAAIWTIEKFLGLFLKLEIVKEHIRSIIYEGRNIKKILIRLEAKKEELQKYQKYQYYLYEEYTEDIISMEDMKTLKERYQKKIQETQREQQYLEKERDKAVEIEKEKNQKVWEWLENLKCQKNIGKIERKMAVIFIKKIEIYENYRIRIQFRF